MAFYGALDTPDLDHPVVEQDDGAVDGLRMDSRA